MMDIDLTPMLLTLVVIGMVIGVIVVGIVAGLIYMIYWLSQHLAWA